MFEDGVYRITVYDVKTKKELFAYKADLIPSKGDVIFSVDDSTYALDLKVKKVRCFVNLPDEFDVYVKVPKNV